MLISEQQLLIPEENYITPLKEVLNTSSQYHIESRHTPLKQSLDTLFPEQVYDEKTVQRTKDILGTLASEFSAEGLKDTITEIQFLTESWLDDFEKKIFDGSTLKELLHEKGGV